MVEDGVFSEHVTGLRTAEVLDYSGHGPSDSSIRISMASITTTSWIARPNVAAVSRGILQQRHQLSAHHAHREHRRQSACASVAEYVEAGDDRPHARIQGIFLEPLLSGSTGRPEPRYLSAPTMEAECLAEALTAW